MTVEDLNKRKSKNDMKIGIDVKGPRQRFLHPDNKENGDTTDHVNKEKGSGDTEPGEPSVELETDETFFKRERKEKQSTPQTRPIRLKIRKSRFYDSGQPKDIKKKQYFLHETLGNLSMDTIKKKIMDLVHSSPFSSG
jgi:hypothetical protein